MSGTPRMPSAFPSTPRTDARRTPQNAFSASARSVPSSATKASSTQATSDANQPLVPFDLIPAPRQRLYVAAFYGALVGAKLYEWWNSSDELDSTWLFLKWVAIDSTFLFGLPGFRIPWLEWSFSTTLTAVILHTVLNGFLMFHIPIPFTVWIGWIVKLVYDREVSVSERRVNPAEVLHNSSLILGKQIIQILPEGSAMLNPDRTPFCLDSRTTSVELPIRINQTSPILIELVRFDLDTNENEIITIPAKQARQLKQRADKRLDKSDKASPRLLHYPVKKTGLYQLQRVVDETKLDVQRRHSDTLVVSCPSAYIEAENMLDKCKGELSGFNLSVTGTPPLKVKYSKRVNQLDHSYAFQSIQPDALLSPLAGQRGSGALVDLRNVDVSWARAQNVKVPIDEAFNTEGTWSYFIEEVQDACGNVVSYLPLTEERSRHQHKSAWTQQEHSFTVHERPRLSFGRGCNAENPLRVAKEDSITMPLAFHPKGSLRPEDAPIRVDYTLAPPDEDGSSDSSVDTTPRSVNLKSESSAPRMTEPGWYKLESVSTKFCSGEIMEPSTCLLYNPPEPSLTLKAEDVSDQCAGNPIGMAVDLDLTGTPPFKVWYNVKHDGVVKPKVVELSGLRGRIELIPETAGHHVYEFLSVQDDVYNAVPLMDKKILEQDVRPPASAHFVNRSEKRAICLGTSVSAKVELMGEGPWELEYELVHRGSRTKHVVQSDQHTYHISTPNLTSGGEYSIVLASVKDKLRCRRSLQEQIKIEVRPDQPRVAFGLIDGRRLVQALADKPVRLPLRLSGNQPWTVTYKRHMEPASPEETSLVKNANDYLEIRQPGKYELVSVQDNCPGLVDTKANEFEIAWIERPSIQLAGTEQVQEEPNGGLRKSDVCQGDEDKLELQFTGAAPFTIQYEQTHSEGRIPVTSNHKITAAMQRASIRMDTSKPGIWTYKFNRLSDSLYDHDSRTFTPLVVRQKVSAPPSARFESPGTTYGYCKEEADGDEVVPIILEGSPPFTLEVGLKHHANSRPEIMTFRDIQTHRYSLTIPRRRLDLGTHSLYIRKVSDARRCESRAEQVSSSSVRVRVSDVPTINEMESQIDYCVGEFISFSLSGQPPFDVQYMFQDKARKAHVTSTTFRRLAEQAGVFTIDSLSDSASGKCKAKKEITKVIHPMPSVKVSRGQVSVVDIHEGGEAEILFEFGGTPPFEFTYTRSETRKGSKKPVVLETRHELSYDYSKRVRTSDAGIYEVVAIKDKYCSFSTAKGAENVGRGQKLLQQ